MSPKEGDSFGEEQGRVAGEVLKSLCHCDYMGSMTFCWIQKSNQAEHPTKRKSSCVCRCWLVSHRAFGGPSMGQGYRWKHRPVTSRWNKTLRVN